MNKIYLTHINLLLLINLIAIFFILNIYLSKINFYFVKKQIVNIIYEQ